MPTPLKQETFPQPKDTEVTYARIRYTHTAQNYITNFADSPVKFLLLLFVGFFKGLSFLYTIIAVFGFRLHQKWNKRRSDWRQKNPSKIIE